jgi:calcineurin-like phosphoesterase family protein
MRIVATSDTHCGHEDLGALPDGDVLVHAGDATWVGNEREVGGFGVWFRGQRHKRKLFVPGNHDALFQEREQLAIDILTNPTSDDGDQDGAIYYGCDHQHQIDGVWFYLTPWTRLYGNWSFMLPDEDLEGMWDARDEPSGRPRLDLVTKFAQIPDTTDILVVHGPPRGTGDALIRNGKEEHPGSSALRDRILTIRPKLVICGHIHGGYGVHDLDGIPVVNVAAMDEDMDVVNPPIVIDYENGKVRIQR